MNNSRRKKLDSAVSLIETAKGYIETVLEEESESRDNLEDSNFVEKYEAACEACGAMEEAIDSLDEAIGTLEEAME